jgi:hypothetical protein
VDIKKTLETKKKGEKLENRFRRHVMMSPVSNESSRGMKNVSYDGVLSHDTSSFETVSNQKGKNQENEVIKGSMMRVCNEGFFFFDFDLFGLFLF